MTQRLISRRDVSWRLDKSTETLSRWASRGEGPPCILINGRAMYREDLLEAWIAKHEAPPMSEEDERRAAHVAAIVAEAGPLTGPVAERVAYILRQGVDDGGRAA
ncbi:helix-turn-helix transcriptional regulator [Cellulosimicrobium cellulans]